MTNRELLDLGVARLREAGIEDAETDARILFEYLTGMDRSALLVRGDEEAGAAHRNVTEECSGTDSLDGNGRDIRESYTGLIEERAGHKPVQYITGTADFMGLSFIVDENVLIPRFDTEFLVEEMMREVGDGASVLDMCTGSGCILLSLMRYKNGIRGTGADISDVALGIARLNEERLFGRKETDITRTSAGGNPEVPYMYDKAEWILSDMFENITGTYDFIVCNPPYIKTGVIATLMPEVKDHEPYLALDGDADGLRFYRIIAEEAPAHLNRHGRLFLEIGFDEAEDVTALLRESGFTEIEAVKDYAGNYRVVKCKFTGDQNV